jgi:hypothetical protein
MAALDLVSEVATDAPLLMVVEDALWLDAPTCDVLAFMARRIESDPIVMLVAVREGQSGGSDFNGRPPRVIKGGLKWVE